MKSSILNFWQQLQPRERWVLLGGLAILATLLFYMLIWHPWHRAINNMTASIQSQRMDLVWMRQQAELIKEGGSQVKVSFKGQDQSVLSVVERTAKANEISDSIQQLTPGSEKSEVGVVLDEVSFNKWVAWVDELHKQYGVEIKQLAAERENNELDVANIRVTFERL